MCTASLASHSRHSLPVSPTTLKTVWVSSSSMEESNPSPVDVRTTNLAEFETGESVRVHYHADDSEPSECVTGDVVTHYTDRKAMIETDDGRRLIVDLRDTPAPGGLRDFDSSETLGRPMFAEPANVPEKDGHALRAELLGDDEDDEDDAPTHTLRYVNVAHGAHETTGKEYTTETTVELDGEVYAERAGLTGFRTPDRDGVFFLLSDGTVMYDPDSDISEYEAGERGEIVETGGEGETNRVGFESWEDFLTAVREEGFPLSEGTAVVLEYESVYSDEPQRVRGRVAAPTADAMGLPFNVESSTDGRVRHVRGWTVRAGNMDGREIGTVARLAFAVPASATDGVIVEK